MCNFWCCSLVKRLAFWALLPKKLCYAAEFGYCCRFFGFDNCKKHHLVLFAHYYVFVTKFKQEINHKSKSAILYANWRLWESKG